MTKIGIDPLDASIVATLQFDADMPVSKLAKLVGVPVHVVHYRLKKLSEKGIIRKWILINPYALGFQEF